MFVIFYKLVFIRLMASPRHSENKFSLCSRLAHKLGFTLAYSLLFSYQESTPIATSENRVYNLNIKFAIRLKL